MTPCHHRRIATRQLADALPVLAILALAALAAWTLA